MDTKDLLELYKSLFETWRFEVNSHWQRSSYFAAFETVAIAACWKLLNDVGSTWAGVVLAALGLCLTGIWYQNNNKTHFYAVYWLEKVAEIERKLVQDSGETIDFAAQILNRPRTGRVRHRHLVQAVPIIFFFAWAILLCVGIFHYSYHRGLSPTMESGTLSHLVTYQSVALASAIVSLLVGVAAVLVAKSSLSQAMRVADRELKDWKQRKWFDLYFKADEAYDMLERFQVLYPDPSDLLTDEGKEEWNDLMLVMRAVNRMAVVFPKNPAIDNLLSTTAIFKDPHLALSGEQRKRVFDAVEGIRQQALIGDLSVLRN
jgi:hypothetical protein